jgi:hypothetical protein
MGTTKIEDKEAQGCGHHYARFKKGIPAETP